MALTAEIRWFWPHATPSAFAVWFRSSLHHECMVGGGRSYTDTHLVWEGHPRWDIRRRSGSISVRAHQTSVPDGCDVAPFQGEIALWFDLISQHEPPSGAVPVDLAGRHWIRVFDTGDRQLREIRQMASGWPTKLMPVDAGPHCQVDLAEYELGDFGERWATFGLTATGPGETLAASIRRTAAVLNERRPPALEDAFVTTLPQWLLSLSPFWRHGAALRHHRAAHAGHAELRPAQMAAAPGAAN
ncbi:hypothetical protein [Ideonella sp.]|uniref:hypothetical protein n=1 Tax=Ideonella sp. TaxID=1929293 RepID=UPI0035B25ACF